MANIHRTFFYNINDSNYGSFSENPEDFSVNLYPFQLMTIQAMKQMESYEKTFDEVTVRNDIAILGNKVGSGKTLTVLGMVYQSKNEQRDLERKQIIQVNQKISIETKNLELFQYDIIPSTLVIVPHHLIGQWEIELNKTKMNYYLIKCKKYLKNLSQEKIPNVDLVIVTSTMLKYFYLKFRDITWDRIILDEFDSISTNCVNLEGIKYRFLWLISATYENGRNRKGSLGKMFKCLFYNRDLLKYYTVKCDPNYIDQFLNFDVRTRTILCKTPIYYNVLFDVNVDRISQMLAAGDIEGAAEKMGVTFSSSEDIVKNYCSKLEKDAEYYEKRIELIKEMYNIETNEEIVSLTKKLDSLITRIKTITERIMNLENEECMVCMETLEEDIVPVIIKCCNSLFCYNCLFNTAKLGNQNCPLCNTQINFNNIIHVTNDNGKINKQREKLDEIKSKEEKCIDLVKSKDGKFLIFASYSSIFKEISQLLKQNNVTFSIIKGCSGAIKNTINKFNNGDIKVLLLNSEYLGAGLNIEQATDIILFNKMGEGMTNQVIGRALRVNRQPNLPLNVYELLYGNEI
ncbi:MAG TPA: helicase-related protein [Allocoleopsis sp.]